MHRNAGPLVSSFPAIQLRANTYIEGNVAKVYASRNNSVRIFYI